MTLCAAVSRWIGEAEAGGATALHLIPDAVPRIRVGRELFPMESGVAGDGEPTGKPPEPLAAGEIVAIVETLFSPGQMKTVRQRGQGECFVETADGRRLHVTAWRAQEQWRVVFLLDHQVWAAQFSSKTQARA